MQMRLFWFSIISLLSVAAASCSDEISFDYNSVEAVPVIEGYVTPAGASVRLSLSRDMADSAHTHTIDDAAVAIIRPDGSSVDLPLTSAGTYTSADISGEAGDIFGIKVIRGGVAYEATDTMGIAPADLSGYFSREKIMTSDRITFRYSFVAPRDTLTCYVAILKRNGEMYKWGTKNSNSQYEDGTVEGRFTCFKEDDIDDEDKQDDVLREGDIMTFSLAGVSRQTYDYLSALNGSSSTNANPDWAFSGGMALGFFSAWNVVEIKQLFQLTVNS